jgi:hypothetical protein
MEERVFASLINLPILKSTILLQQNTKFKDKMKCFSGKTLKVKYK